MAGPAKLVTGDQPKDEASLKDAAKLVADHERGCDDTSWKLRGATLRSPGVSWRDDWEAPLTEAMRRLGQCGQDYRIEVCGVEDITSYGSNDIDVRVQGDREAAGAARAHGRAERVFHILQDKLGKQYRSQLGFCEDKILAEKGERGVDVMFLHAPRPAATAVVAAAPGPKGDQGPQGPPGPAMVGPAGPPGPSGEGVFSTLQLGVNTQLKDEDFRLLSLAQLRLGVGELFLVEAEIGGDPWGPWRFAYGFGLGIRHKLTNWIAISGVGFGRALRDSDPDLETGLGLQLDADLAALTGWNWFRVIVGLRGEAKLRKTTSGKVPVPEWWGVYGDSFPFVPAATAGGFIGWKF